ncbi:MAG: substrate-binding periplasmic protein [Burkholderiaceae bacterium]
MKIVAHIKCKLFCALFLVQIGYGMAVAAPFLIAVEDDAAPWSQRDGTGFANDIVRAAFKAAGSEIELAVVPYARCKDMAIKGKAAACFTMSWIPELAGKIVFADKPLFRCSVDYFVSNKHPLKANSEETIPKGTVIGIVIGYEYPQSFYALKEKSIVVLEESESEELNLKKLSLGRIDAALVTHNETKPAELLMARARVTGQVNRAFRSGVNDSFIGFSTKHPDGLKAMEKFNEGYRIITANGDRRLIEQRWRSAALKEVSDLTEKQTK